jgi:chromosome partitioning protein
MRTSIIPWCDGDRTPHVVVIGNHKGGSGKSTFAMHIIVALLKSGKRVATFDLDSGQLTLTRYINNRREWAREKKLELELPDHYPGAEELGTDIESSNAADLAKFMSQLKDIEHGHKQDFIIIDTPGGAQHLSLLAHGMADTLITPINDSLIDLDLLVAIGPTEPEPQPSRYANTVSRALEARRTVYGRTTDWVVIRNRLELVPSRNQRQVTRVLEAIRKKLGFRMVRGLSERPAYREFFAAGLTAFDPLEELMPRGKPSPSSLLARLEVQEMVQEIGLILKHVDAEAAFGGAIHEVELAMAEPHAADIEDEQRPPKPSTKRSS